LIQPDWINDIHLLSEDLTPEEVASVSIRKNKQEFASEGVSRCESWRARHWTILRNLKQAGMVFDLAYLELVNTLQQEGLGVMSKTACRNAWRNFPKLIEDTVSLHMKTDYTKHDDILKKVLTLRDSSTLSLKDVYMDVSALFAEAKLPQMTMRLFSQHWLGLRSELNFADDSCEENCQRRLYTSGHKTIVKEVVFAHPETPVRKLFQLASEKFAHAKLSRMTFSSFRAWTYEVRKANKISKFNPEVDIGSNMDEILSDLFISNPKLTLPAACEALRNSPKLAGDHLPSRDKVKSWLEYMKKAISP
jgi:hypothetical protein